MPIWKLKPTERPAQPWYSEDLSIKRNQSGKRFTDDELERHERRDNQLKELEDPLRVLSQSLCLYPEAEEVSGRCRQRRLHFIPISNGQSSKSS